MNICVVSLVVEIEREKSQGRLSECQLCDNDEDTYKRKGKQTSRKDRERVGE